MFDIGFFELVIIGVVAVLVIGPERLPKVARTVGMWLGRGRRFVASVKSDIEREIAADELKKTLAKQAESQGLYDIIEETKESIQSLTAESPVKTEDNRPAEPAADSGKSEPPKAAEPAPAAAQKSAKPK